MDIRLAPLTDRAQYYLEDAVEYGVLLPGTRAAVLLYGRSEEVEAAVGTARAWRCGAPAAVLALAARLLEELPESRAAALVAMDLVGARRAAQDLAEHCSSWAVTDETYGGASRPFHHAPRLTPGGLPRPGAVRRLRSTSWIRRYVRFNPEVDALVRLAAAPLRRTYPEGTDLPAVVAGIAADLARQRAATRAAWSADPGWRIRNADLLRLDPCYRGVATPRPYCATRRERRVVVRAAATAEAVLGAASVGRFARGEAVLLERDGVGLRVRRSGRMSDPGHGRVAVELVAGEVRLASLCVYAEDCPVLDQLTALALHVEAGLLEEVVAAANLVSVEPDGLVHPLLAGRVGTLTRDRYGHERLLVAAYWHGAGALWRDAVETRVLGSARRGAARLAELLRPVLAPTELSR